MSYHVGPVFLNDICAALSSTACTLIAKLDKRLANQQGLGAGETVTRVRPFLMFQGGTAAAAIEMYLAAFPGASAVSSTPRPEPATGIVLAELDLAGLRVLVGDSAVKHGFGFTPSSSLFVDVADRAELERLVAELGK
nr:VOC family protein [Mycobacterium sp. UM_NZ2]